MRLWQRFAPLIAPYWCRLPIIGELKLRKTLSFASLFLVGLSLSIALASCDNNATAKSPDEELTLVSYSVSRAAYEKIIPQFTNFWQQQHNQNVKFSQSYGGSGSQARAVNEGLDGDVVALSLSLDIKRIEKAGLIKPDWAKQAPNNSFVTKSVVALVTRDGNPKGIKTWADLAKDGVSVITANPKTSGGARWNFLALWGAVTQTGGTDEQALEFTSKVFKNAPLLPRDGREATDAFFKQEQGDVLITYENEAILAKLHGQDLPYIVPDVNISIENPVAVVDKNVDKHNNRQVAEGFVKFLFTPEAQREFAKVGFRSVDSTVAQEFTEHYPQIATLFTVKDLGGWNAIQKKFFDDGGIFDKIQASIQQK